MAFRDLFGRRPPPPASPPLPVKAAPIVLARAPTYQPVPVNPADPVDAAVARLWLAYQRQHSNPSWASFVSDLRTGNADVTERLRRAESELADYRRMEVFRP